MIANDNKINGRTVDYTKTLEFLAHYLMAPGCRVVLDETQFEILKAYLAHIDAVGDDTNFQLEMCVDYRDSEDSGGYSVCWDNDGTIFEDDLIDAIMVDLVQNLGFDAGSIFRPGHITELNEIDGRIADIKSRVLERSRQRVLDGIVEKPVTEYTPQERLPGQQYSELTDLKMSWILMAHRCDQDPQWIADQLNLSLEAVEQIISSSKD